jgi:hypothetical protein
MDFLIAGFMEGNAETPRRSPPEPRTTGCLQLVPPGLPAARVPKTEPVAPGEISVGRVRVTSGWLGQNAPVFPKAAAPGRRRLGPSHLRQGPGTDLAP